MSDRNAPLFAGADACREVAWHGGCFAMPPEWEVASFSTHPEQGSLVFHSPRGAEGRLFWRRVKETPDIERTQLDVHRRELAKTDPEEAERLGRLSYEKIGRFRLAWRKAGEMAQAATYDADNAWLVEWQFPVWNPQSKTSAWQPLLASFRPHTPGPSRRWALLGVGATLPETYAIHEVTAQPAAVALVFSGPGRMTATLRRWGLAGYHLARRSLADWYTKGVIRALKGRIVGTDPRTIGGHPGTVVEYDCSPELFMERLAGRWWRGQGWVWHDAEENRIHAFEQLGPIKAKRLGLNEVVGVEA